MSAVERIERLNEVGARVTAEKRACEVTFARRGPLGGRVRISESGKVIVDRPLAVGGEDNYRKWQGKVREIVGRLFGECGTKAVYIDQVPAFPAIYGGSIQMFGRAYRGAKGSATCFVISNA